LLKKLKKDGWRIVLFFLWIPSADFSRNRIRERVKHGGHSVPDDTIYRRFPRIMRNLMIYIPLCDKVVCYDNSGPKPVLVFRQDEKGQYILNQDIYEKILRYANDYKRNQ